MLDGPVMQDFSWEGIQGLIGVEHRLGSRVSRGFWWPGWY